MRRSFGRRRAFPFIFIAFAFIALSTFVVMTLWNNILAPVLKVNTINFWQALGILALSKILFGGFPGRWRGTHGWGWNKQMIEKRREMMDKWHTMTPEEKEKFKQEWKSRCRNWGRPQEQKEENREQPYTKV